MPMLNLIGLSVIFYTVIIILFFLVTEKLIKRERKHYDKIHTPEKNDNYRK